MFSSGPSYSKLKTNLRLSINRLKLLEKKKTELTQKARREIADYLSGGKDERAKIRVEHIVREDYLVEAMELIEMYCDLLLARFGLIQQMKTVDEGLQEAISSIIWAAPRLQTDCQELKVIADQLCHKYGKPYAQACRENSLGHVSEKLMHKLGVQAPPKLLVERYLIEIARSHNVPYEPDPTVMNQDEVYAAESQLIDFGGKGGLGPPPGPPDLGGSGGGGGGGGMVGPPMGVSFPQPMYPPAPQPGVVPFAYPNLPDQGAGSGGFYPPTAPYPSRPPSYCPAPKNAFPSPPRPDEPSPNYSDIFDNSVTDPPQSEEKPPLPTTPPKAAPRGVSPSVNDTLELPDLPAVPMNSFPKPGGTIGGAGGTSGDDIDFDDLTKRFEELKKKK
ncbi:PREDICTED: IST1 homolog isoform X1 [Priapulus caudatus]|uniref:IST1 homolog n=1 Tax=Priapulus caudatus TaxID=37621 RepID=A0ABM1DTY3_PRICU|nr:PREDICTED: IST1 homolog isoform X1 [Priapulus caudatus]XP_014663403.1 PREDICTED: IST1 homolog isoform X1 [Priapulus caudatus]XP_014663404.1 PREDICTED: IST1 homolog isoform X1 [Priapulus caudatus]